MAKKTKFEKMELYADMYRELEPFADKIKQSAHTKTVRGLSWDQLHTTKDIYEQYYSGVTTDFNCSQCIMKMMTRMSNLIKKYEKDNKE